MAEEQAPVTEQVTQEQPAQNDVSRETIPERPEEVPEKFWNTETGQVRVEDLVKSYNHVEKLSTGKKEELREEVLKDLQTEAIADLPENAEAYALPKLVEGVTEEMVEANPLTGWWRNKCHDMGLDQDQFEDGINQYVDLMLGNQPNVDEEVKKLGENANARLDAVSGFTNSNFTPEENEIINTTLGTNAIGIGILEKIINLTKSSVSSADTVAQPQRELTVTDVKAMMNDKRYYDSRHRDPDFVKKVDAAWSRLNTVGSI
tara:strand:- start:17 stop:799 length:783 start_codon:yes stop_codon:yes gene_type:complete